MAKTWPIQTNFTAGQLSPRLHGRVDINKYNNGLKLQKNAYSLPHGGVVRRGGFHYVAGVQTNSKKVRLVRFEFSVTQAYILEFGDLYVRFYKDNGQIESGGSPVQVTTPFTEAQLFDLYFAQSADTLYIAHSSHAPRKLTRSSHTSWTLSTLTFSSAPSNFAGGAGDYPRCVTFFEERLYWAGTDNNPQTMWASKSGDFLNMDQGTGLDDESVEFTLATDDVNVIRWMKASDVLLVGTVGGEFKLHGNGNPVTPSNVRVVQETKYGSSTVTPVTSGRAVLFNQRATKKIRQMIFDLNVEGYVAPDLTILAEDITGDGITHMAYQQEPDSIIWAVRDDGTLIGLTYQRDQQVVAWHQHPIGGYFGEATITVTDAANIAAGSTITITLSDGTTEIMTATADDPPASPNEFSLGDGSNNGVADNIAIGTGGVLGINALTNLTAPNPAANVVTVTDQAAGLNLLSITSSDSTRLTVTNQGQAVVESVAVIPSADGKSDELWASIKRTVDGNTVRYVEYLDPAIFVDSGLTYSGSAVSSLSGLDHLEGQCVQIVGDDAVFSRAIVSSGTVTTSAAVSTAYIGLHYPTELTTLQPEVPQRDGSSFGKKKSWNRIILNLYQTLGISVNDNQLVFRTGGDAMDSAPPKFTGQFDITSLGWKEVDATITVKQEQPLGMTLISMSGELNVND
jgi:hypothetical protein|tara:strand:- start:1155 stop:3203 length:2049 start_codon:yes stop_codon:yes gene_type:complete